MAVDVVVANTLWVKKQDIKLHGKWNGIDNGLHVVVVEWIYIYICFVCFVFFLVRNSSRLASLTNDSSRTTTLFP